MSSFISLRAMLPPSLQLISFSFGPCASLIIIALMFSGCTSITSVRGRYAASLSPGDIRQIRRLAQPSPHLGHTLFTFDAVQRSEVHVCTREYLDSGSDGEDFYVTRREGRWVVDERHQRL